VSDSYSALSDPTDGSKVWMQLFSLLAEHVLTSILAILDFRSCMSR
jgi:hypothetical protein